MGASFSTDNIDDQSGKVFVITGANTGVGKECAEVLAAKGAHVIMACRSAERATPVVEEIKAATGNDKVEFMECDLASLDSVHAFATAMLARDDLAIDVLINNAGVMLSPYALTKDGLELQFGTNHVGHFLLTKMLLPKLLKTENARIVVLSSLAHAFMGSAPPPGYIQFDALDEKAEAGYDSTSRYCQSKLANMLFGRSLARRLAGTSCRVNIVHPGFVRTDLGRHVKERGWLYSMGFAVAEHVAGISVQQGALTSLYAATHGDIEHSDLRGQYLVPIAKLAQPKPWGTDDELAEKVWDVTERILKEKGHEVATSELWNPTELPPAIPVTMATLKK